MTDRDDPLPTEPIGACQCRTCRRDIDQDAVPTVEQARGGRAWAIARMSALLDHGDMAGVARLAVYLRACEAQEAAHATLVMGKRDHEANDRMRAEVATLRTYLTQRMARGDWHGVMDAAADIREIEAGLQILSRARVDEIDTEIGDALRRFMATGRPWVAPIIEDDK